MRKISLWARHNKWSARILIIVSFIMLNGIGFIIGMLLTESGCSLSPVFFATAACLYLLAFIFYPGNLRNGRRRSSGAYLKRKSFDFILAASAFLMTVYVGARPEILFSNGSAANAMVSAPLRDSSNRGYKTMAGFSEIMKDEQGKLLNWKQRKKLLKVQINAIKKAKEISEGEKVGLIILSVLIAIGLLYLVAAAACTLSCNGADGAALLVGIGGTALVIFLLIIVIRSITRKRKRKTNTEQPGNS